MVGNTHWKVLVELPSETDARLLQGYLEDAGVACEVESLVYHAEPVMLGQLARVRIWVLESQSREAEELLRAAEAGEIDLPEQTEDAS